MDEPEFKNYEIFFPPVPSLLIKGFCFFAPGKQTETLWLHIVPHLGAILSFFTSDLAFKLLQLVTRNAVHFWNSF